MSKPRFYTVLGVGVNATADQIKKAYRKKARQHHPDAGGDQEKFLEVQLAYEVLIDDDRRRRYDETGEFDQAPRVGIPIHIRDVLVAALDDVLFPEPTFGPPTKPDPAQTNLKRLTEEWIALRKKVIQKSIKEWHEREATLKKAVGRFTTDQEDNIMDGMIRAMEDNARRMAANGEKALKELDEVVEFLKDYRYEFAVVKKDQYAWRAKMLEGGPMLSFTFRSPGE